jgi:hypothetical protein
MAPNLTPNLCDLYEDNNGNLVRKFPTGATRDTDDGKPDYRGFFSPLVFKRYGEYMNQHRKQSDGQLRASDNWKKGIPLKEYASSHWRHFIDFWTLDDGFGPIYDIKDGHEITKEETLCAIIFNASGYLHELLKSQQEKNQASDKAYDLDSYGEYHAIH